MNSSITRATVDQVPQLVASAAVLFRTDGGRHDAFMDMRWPERDGFSYYDGLVRDGCCLCLLAFAGDADSTPAGHLVGRIQRANSLRPQAVTAVLESMRVDARYRRAGIGKALVGEFFTWARGEGVNEARVTAYSANEVALAFYREQGFTRFQVTLHAPV